MNKKILLAIMISGALTSTAYAENINKNLNAGAYGQLGVTDNTNLDDLYYEYSHLNIYSDLKLDKKNVLSANIGLRSHYKNNDFKYNVFLDELNYKFIENKDSNFTIGRFYNPIGINKNKPYDKIASLSNERGNEILSIDGVKLQYLGSLDKKTSYVFDAFIGTSLSDSYIDEKEIDLGTKFNYGANVTFNSYIGNFNFGLTGANNGDEIKINDVNKELSGDSLYYNANIGYELNNKRTPIYLLVDFNLYDFNFDDSEDIKKETLDTLIGYKFDQLTPLIGYTIEKNENYFENREYDKSIFKVGLRYEFNKSVAVSANYDYIDESDSESYSLYGVNVLFKY